ncbi:UDP-N-acetylmuramoyl-L-alanyl-D-glutamate--2,6-diaminopimelate ligase [Deltaproteobacteria bacterium]|nr:UDP-N-acetylmuramoyl-L-alanyl-D-glutamate--2,6-diaminopimelate ligase [Deltaproteobacteria bacterium]
MVALSRLAGQMNLKISGSGEVEIIGITEDSRLVRPGWMFAALPGTRFDGREFLGEAVAKGAAAVLMTEPDVQLPVPRLLVAEGRLRPVMAVIAGLVYGRPADRLILVGLTGTNGKTTTAYLLEAVLRQAGLNPGVMGTVNYRWPGHWRPAANTTPEGPVLSATLAEMAAAGCRSAVLEISSHGLALGRVTGLSFEAALFTNLSRDHLDFHPDMESYYQAKRELFIRHLRPGGRRAVINIDDEYGRRLAGELGDRALTFGFGPQAGVRGENLVLGREGLSLDIICGGLNWRQSSPLLAEINGYNVLAAAALALALHIPQAAVAAALAACPGAPGRLEKVGPGGDRLILVDYAHSPDALAKALQAARDLKPARLAVVFGCGGDRDRGKRPLMGRVAGEAADLVLVTSDNPRTEAPEAIMAEIESGLAGLNLARLPVGGSGPAEWRPGSCLLIPDRRAAIGEAVRLLGAGDILLIAGKGHENYQIIGRDQKPFDDRAEALAALQAAGWAR